MCYRTDAPPEGGAGFGSLAALLATYPAGSYLLSLDAGALTAQLDFAPQEPDGNVTQQGGVFQYGTGAERRTVTGFTVPEPTAGLASASALAAMGACVRRRPRCF